jgi:hypothetical protein
LPPPIAEALAALTFAMLKSGGRLLITNAIHTVKDAGDMELFMDWWLVYRNSEEVASLVSRLPAQDVFEVRQWDTSYFVYLERRSDSSSVSEKAIDGPALQAQS